jgi:hypothetical protein
VTNIVVHGLLEIFKVCRCELEQSINLEPRDLLDDETIVCSREEVSSMKGSSLNLEYAAHP